MQQDEAYISAMKAFNEGDYENAYHYMKQSGSLTSDKRDSFMNSCLHAITEQYSYMIKEFISNGDYMRASGAKSTYINRYGENPIIAKIEIPSLVEDKESDYIEPSFWDQWKWWIIGICAILIVVALFVLRNTEDEVDNNYIVPVEEVVEVEVAEDADVECVVEVVPDTLTYSGPYTLGREVGRAKYSYVCVEGDTIYEGPFRFDEGGYSENGTFSGGSSTVSIFGIFKNNVQDGEWLIGSGHMGASLNFENGKLNGPFEWDYTSGGYVREARGTYKDGHLIGKFTHNCVEYDSDGTKSINSIKGEFDSQGQPIGIWEQVVDNKTQYYVMDRNSAESSGYQGRFVKYDDGSTSMYNANLELDFYLFNPNILVFRDTPKIETPTTVFPTYWKE